MIQYSKCKRCKDNFNILELKDNPDGVGMVCIDEASCQQRQPPETTEKST